MPSPLRCPSLLSSTVCTKQLCRTGSSSRSFSTTSRNDQRITRARRRFFTWLSTTGAVFKNPLPGSTNYMGAYNKEGKLFRVLEAAREKGSQSKAQEGAAGSNNRLNSDSGSQSQNDNSNATAAPLPPETARDRTPFPLNRTFQSQHVLSSRVQEHIWELVIQKGMSVREVSALVNVEMSRVAAVVRLLEIEKEWRRINKPLAERYHEAVQGMLPKTDWNPAEETQKRPSHESINDLPVHAATGQQIFLPTAESRRFTRADAAKVFDDRLLPADARVPHRELAVLHREVLQGLSPEEQAEREAVREAAREKKRSAALERQAIKDASTKKVDIGRYEYRFTEIKVDDAGKDGRGVKGVGWRYGVPLMDRSRGQHKIPQSVE